MMENPARILATLLLGNTFVNIAASSLGVNLISTYFRGDRAIVVSTLAMTVLILVFGEITPKTMAVQRSESIASWVVNPGLYDRLGDRPGHIGQLARGPRYGLGGEGEGV